MVESVDIIQFGYPGYTDDYKEAVFTVWYNSGKVGATHLRENIPFPQTNEGKKPSIVSLAKWINNDFKNRAQELDAGVRRTMDAALVESQIEMLNRHIIASREMQELALDWLKTHTDDLTPQAAVRLWVEAVREEKKSAGIPEMLEKMHALTDDELYKEIEKIMQEGTLEFEEEEDDNRPE